MGRLSKEQEAVQRAEIRRRLKSDEPVQRIAEALECSRETVYGVKREMDKNHQHEVGEMVEFLRKYAAPARQRRQLLRARLARWLVR